MRDILKIIGNNIKEIRKSLGISQEKLAELAELHRTYVGGVERGERNISALNLQKISMVLGVQASELLAANIGDVKSPDRLGTVDRDLFAPIAVDEKFFNSKCELPYKLEVSDIKLTFPK